MKVARIVSFVKRLNFRSPKLRALLSVSIIPMLAVPVFIMASSWRSPSISSLNTPHGDSKHSSGNALGASTTISVVNSEKNNTSASGSGSPGSALTANTSSNPGTKSSGGTSVKPGTNSGTNQPSAPAELKLSTYNMTLGNWENSNTDTAQLTVSSNAGPITQPTRTICQLVSVGEINYTPQSSTVFKDQWTLFVTRESVPGGGSDIVTLTSKTESGQTVTAQLNVSLEWIPSFTDKQGSLTQVANSDGTITITAHITLVPSANFGNPIIHLCDYSTYRGSPVISPCDSPDSYSFKYNGNNDLSFTKTVSSTDHYLSVEIFADATYGNYILPWSF